MSPPILCLMGPTASGKTALAVRLVQQFPLEIVSVDSVMVYRGMNIGAAKPDLQTLAAAPHKLIDIRNPDEIYSAADFCHDARQAINAIFQAGKIPLLVGGSMLYFHALQGGMGGMPSADPVIRQQLTARAETEGWETLHATLATVDPVAAGRIHPHDSQRIQRALEVHVLTGRPISSLQAQTGQGMGGHPWCNLVIAPADRGCLHERIAQRFDQMLAEGLVEETSGLLEQGYSPDLPALRSAGYRQAGAFLAGELEAGGLRERGVIATRQLAKRQLTWLRHWEKTLWFDSEAPDLYDKVAAIVQQVCGNL